MQAWQALRAGAFLGFGLVSRGSQGLSGLLCNLSLIQTLENLKSGALCCSGLLFSYL